MSSSVNEIKNWLNSLSNDEFINFFETNGPFDGVVWLNYDSSTRDTLEYYTMLFEITHNGELYETESEGEFEYEDDLYLGISNVPDLRDGVEGDTKIRGSIVKDIDPSGEVVKRYFIPRNNDWSQLKRDVLNLDSKIEYIPSMPRTLGFLIEEIDIRSKDDGKDWIVNDINFGYHGIIYNPNPREKYWWDYFDSIVERDTKSRLIPLMANQLAYHHFQIDMNERVSKKKVKEDIDSDKIKMLKPLAKSLYDDVMSVAKNMLKIIGERYLSDLRVYIKESSILFEYIGETRHSSYIEIDKYKGWVYKIYDEDWGGKDNIENVERFEDIALNYKNYKLEDIREIAGGYFNDYEDVGSFIVLFGIYCFLKSHPDYYKTVFNVVNKYFYKITHSIKGAWGVGVEKKKGVIVDTETRFVQLYP